MSLFPFSDSGFLQWLVRASWQAAVLAALIVVTQALLGRRLTPVWRYRLWLLVVVRLVLPFQAPSPTSVHNLTASLSHLTTRSSATGSTAPRPIPPPIPPPAPRAFVTADAQDLHVSEPPGARAGQLHDTTPQTTIPPSTPAQPPTGPEPNARPRITSAILTGGLAWIWLAVVLILALRIAVQNARFARRLRRDGTPAPASVTECLEACRATLGVRTDVRAIETDEVQSPAVYGLFRPTLLLPRGLVAEFSPDQLRFVLLHELAHVKRGDTRMTWVMAALQVLHWFNPVVWLAFHRMRVDRELACDALVLACGRDEETVGYGETILRLLEVMNRGNAMPGLVGILEHKHQIQERIRRIATFRRPNRASAWAALLLLALGWVGLTDAASNSKPLPPVVPLHLTNLLVQAENRAWLEESVWKAPPRGSVDPEPDRHLLVTVQDREGQPLPNAEIRIRIRASGEAETGIALTNVFTTDTQGLADVAWPAEGTERLQITTSKPDFIARRMVWDLKTGDTIPAAHTVRLRRAIQIGGTVVDPDGQPVTGAIVVLGRYRMGGEPSPSKGDDVEFERQERTTGADGRWTAVNVPPEILTRIGITARHPDFMNPQVSSDPTRETLQQLTNQTHVLTLPRGLQARGRVVDDQDRPVEGATVWLGGRNTVERQQTTTDAEGRFTFRSTKEGRTLFSVLARSFEPATQYQNVRSDMPDVVFRLTAGTVVRGRVQNALGEPLPGARVSLEERGVIGRTYEFSTRTDDEGRFEWQGAPRETMPFHLHAPGYEQKRDHLIPPDQDNVIVLRTHRRLIGQVVDAETGAPLPRFRLALGRAFGGSLDQFFPDHPGLTDYTAADGRFELELDLEDTNAIQAEAEDHAGTTELLPSNQEEVIHLTLRLKPSRSLHAQVVDAAGRPVGGVSVTVASGAVDARTSHRAPQFRAGRFSVEWREGVVTTGDDGKFSLPSPPLDGWVHAAHATGFASLPLAALRASGQLVLQPYGRIEGTLTVLGQPLAGEEFLLGLSGLGLQADFSLHRQVTDAQGRFVFEQVPPGSVGAIRLVRTEPGSWSIGVETPVHVEPGRTTRITVGDAGAVVRGRVRLATPPAGENWILRGLLHARAPQKRYPVKVEADGSLRVDSVAPGVYTLSVTAEVPGVQRWNSKIVAMGGTEVTVPAEANPLTPIQLDDVELKPLRNGGLGAGPGSRPGGSPSP